MPTLTVCWCRQSDCRLSAVEPFRSLHLVLGTICQTLLHQPSYYILSGVISIPISLSPIFSAHYCDTRVDLRRARLVLGWVTLSGVQLPMRGNLSQYITSHPGQLSLAILPSVGAMSTCDGYTPTAMEENDEFC